MKRTVFAAGALLLVVAVRRAARSARHVVTVRVTRTGDGPWAAAA